jgi:hypothetical protein
MLERAFSIAFWIAAVADHGQRGKTELTSAFDNLGHAINRDQLFHQIVASLCISGFCH